MTLLNLVQPVSCGQSQYLLQALSAHSSYRFSIDTSQDIENYFEGGEKISFRRILLGTSVIVCIAHFCTGLGNETGKFQNIKKNRHMNFLSVYWS